MKAKGATVPVLNDLLPETAADDLSRIFPGDSELAQLMRAFDWSRTGFGDPRHWPENLRVSLGLCLKSRIPVVMYWGPEFRVLYNDPYISFLGEGKHPRYLGQPARECWREIWGAIGPMLEGVYASHEATWSEDVLMFFARRLPLEEVYVRFTFGPILAADGSKVDGIFCPCTETTEQVIGARRLNTLRKLGVKAGEAKSVEIARRDAMAVLAENRADIPFAAIYTVTEDGGAAHLAGSAHIDNRQSPLPATIQAQDAEPLLAPFVSVLRNRRVETATTLASHFVRDPHLWPGTATEALVLPIVAAGHASLSGLLVAGISSRLVLDDAYRTFLELVAGHIGTAIADAQAYEAERKRAEALAEIDRAKTAFFSNVSHEFRTPLTLMLGPLEDLKGAFGRSDSGISLPQYQQLDLVHRNGLRLLKLVNTLLDFSRIEAGRVQAVYEPVDLAAHTADLASVFRSATDKAGITLTVDCPTLAEPAFVDREMWEKIVLNLVSNAFKFTFEGEIEVKLRQTGKHFELSVRDTGAGIPEDELPKVFERFHRVAGAQGRTHEGSGIGLALVRELVRLHSGSVSVESVYGQGATFRVFLPTGRGHLPHKHVGAPVGQVSTALGARPFVEEALRWLPERPADEEAIVKDVPLDEAATGVDGERARVLLADDNGDMRDYLARLLATRYEVEAVGDGLAALRAVEARRPDLVLSDVMMPRLDGFGLLKALREHAATRTLPIILLSARAGEEARVEGVEAGADDYLTKPFSARELLARVATHLELARVRKAAEEKIAAMADDRRRRVEELETLLDAVPVGVFIADDPACERITMNRAGAAMLRLEVTRNASKTGPGGERLSFRVLKDGIELAGPDLPMQRAARLGRPVIGEELDVLFPDGGCVTLYEYAAPLFDASGRVRGCLGVFVDVTERKRAEQALRDSESRFRAMADTAPAMLWVTEPDGACAFLSRGWYDFTGQTEETGLGFGRIDAVHPDDREKSRITFLAANERQEAFGLEHRLRRADGEYRWVIDAGRPRFTPDGGFLGFIGSVIDIHERRLAEDQQRLLARELNHRTKNTLSIIQAIASSTLRFTPEPQAFGLAFSSRLAALAQVQDLLITKGWTTATLGEIAQASLMPFAGDDGPRRAVRIDGPAVLLGPDTAVSLSLVLHELATNAAKYGALKSENGTVSLTWDFVGQDRSDVELTWEEIGGPPVTPPARQGFGTRLFEGMAGPFKIDLAYRREGVRCRITIRPAVSAPEQP